MSRAPARISFFGGGTDYPEWFRQYGGTVCFRQRLTDTVIQLEVSQ